MPAETSGEPVTGPPMVFAGIGWIVVKILLMFFFESQILCIYVNAPKMF